ncbi:MAG: glycosyltransferase family 39 protein [Myxococcales bacterium]|nr:glycosyltransferase family 39 protein [Myxococcales bacterium]
MIGTRRLDARDHGIGAGLAIAYVVLLASTSAPIAWSRDESFYWIAARDYGAWFAMLTRDPSRALERAVIDAAWDYNAEHPGLMKSAFALSWLAYERWGWAGSASLALRLPAMLCGGLLLWVTYLFGARLFGRQAGAFAAVAVGLMPHVFFHAHLACFDVPIATWLLLTTYLYWRSLERPWWSLAAGLAYGLALATKHNAWILPGVLLIHWVWVALAEWRARRRGQGRRLTLVPWWLLAMAVLGPAVFVATWPWLWHDGWERFLWYARFHLAHEYYNIAYFGVNWYWPPFPVSYPFVMTAFTVPATTLLLGIAGLGSRLRTLLPPGLESRVAWRWLGTAQPDARRSDVLLVGCLLAPLVVIALPSTPIFGGTKHWLAAYPFVAIYAGHVFRRVVQATRRLVGERLPAARWTVRALVGSLLLAPAAVDTIRSHPFGIAHYGFLAGGTPGAADRGMNRQFWGMTHGPLGDWLRRALPDGGTVWICDARPESWEIAQRDGLLPANVRPVGSMAAADLILVHHEHHFAEVDFQAWVLTGRLAPVHVLSHDGVPLVSVYRRRAPPSAEVGSRDRRSDSDTQSASVSGSDSDTDMASGPGSGSDLGSGSGSASASVSDSDSVTDSDSSAQYPAPHGRPT